MVNLIKSYLPLRVRLPSPIDPSAYEETILFVKQHGSSGSSSSSSSQTLFIANAPFYPNVRTNIILQSLFERYGDVEKVIVAHNPRKNVEENVDKSEDLTVSMFKKEIGDMEGLGHKSKDVMTFNEHSWYDQGKYAQVVFTSPKTMNRVWNQLNGKRKQKVDGVIKFGKLEMQELEDVSRVMYKKQMKTDGNSESETDEEEDDDGTERTRGIYNLLAAKKASIPSRETLKAVCDQIMDKFEQAEEDALQRQLTAKNQPDDDGFVTVNYNTNVGDIVDLEVNGTLGSTGAGGSRRRKEAMRRNRSSRNDVVKGNDELQDFYRFQLKESKKRNMDELKSRFQDDLKRVKKMKEDKMFRPF